MANTNLQNNPGSTAAGAKAFFQKAKKFILGGADVTTLAPQKIQQAIQGSRTITIRATEGHEEALGQLFRPCFGNTRSGSGAQMDDEALVDSEVLQIQVADQIPDPDVHRMSAEFVHKLIPTVSAENLQQPGALIKVKVSMLLVRGSLSITTLDMLDNKYKIAVDKDAAELLLIFESIVKDLDVDSIAPTLFGGN